MVKALAFVERRGVTDHMNVLYLTMNPNRQSTTVPTEGWLRLLVDKGLQPVLVSRESGDFQEWAAAHGTPTYEDALPAFDKLRPWIAMRSLWRLKRVVRKHNIELIHCNEQDIYPFGKWLAHFCNLPIVVSIHFTMARDFCQWAFAGWGRPDRMFFVSGGNQDACQAGVDGIVPEGNQRVLANGLDLRKFKPDPDLRHQTRNQWGVGDHPVVGVACALRPRKQLEHLIDAMCSSGLEDTHVVVAGAAIAEDQHYAEKLIQAGREKLGDRLIYLGHLDDLRGFYNGLDAFVNTSQEEACSISVIEALASGCPVVGYPSKSVDGQILPDGGEIVEQDNVLELSQVLSAWASDKEGLAARRHAARETAEARFDIAKACEYLWREYQAVLSETRA